MLDGFRQSGLVVELRGMGKAPPHAMTSPEASANPYVISSDALLTPFRTRDIRN